MSFKAKLYLAFSAVLMLMVLSLGMAMFWIYQFNNNVNEVIQDRYEKTRVAVIMEQRVYLIDSSLKNLIIHHDGNMLEVTLAEIDKYQEEQKLAYETYVRVANHPEVLELLPRLKTTLDNHERLTRDMINLTRKGYQAEATNLLMSDGQRIMGQAMALTRELRLTQERIMIENLEESTQKSRLTELILAIFVSVSFFIGVIITIRVIGNVTDSLKQLSTVIGSAQDTEAQILPRITITSRDEIGDIAAAFNEMATAAEHHRRQEIELITAMEEQNWFKSQLAEMSTMLQSVNEQTVLGKAFITKLASTVGASYGVLYLVGNKGDRQALTKLASYAGTGGRVGADSVQMGQGITGQCAAQNQSIILEHVPQEYIKITSGLGSAQPDYVAVFPAAFGNKVVATVELAGFGQLTDMQRQYIKQVMNNMAIILIRVTSRMQIEQLLAKSQAATEELQSQSEELLQQQEELKIANERLAEQYKKSEQKTYELVQAKASLEEQARQLDLTARYKTEFLANMSHELRTPLNSLLILAQMLATNSNDNLTPKQLEYAYAIHSAGSDLFLLINDILDLSKLESGKISIMPEPIDLTGLMSGLITQFKPVAERAGLEFRIDMGQEVPKEIYTDTLRVQQILKNLLSNAFKFTEKGWVKFSVKQAANSEWLAFEVSDSGIGIAADKQTIIFEAFHQADGTTSRKYGGTGLGLSISRKLSRLLGGYINLESREGYGTTFTLYLPSQVQVVEDTAQEEVASTVTKETCQAEVQQPAAEPPSIQRANGGATNLTGKKVLIIDDDMRNIYALVAAMEVKGIVALFAQNGHEGLNCLKQNQDVELVIMDIMMPEMDGYEAIQEIRRLPAFYDLPIIALTAKAMKHDRDKCMEVGASDYISKPVNLDQLFSLMRVWLYR